MNRYISLAMICWFLLSVNCFARTWWSANGRHSVEAELVSRTGDSVVLKTSSGKTITVALPSLSASDIDFVNRTMPDQADESNGDAEPSEPSATEPPVAGPPKPAKEGVEGWQAGCDPGPVATSHGIEPISLTPFDRCTAGMIGRTHFLVKQGGTGKEKFLRGDLAMGQQLSDAPHPPERTAKDLIVNQDATLCGCVPFGESGRLHVWSVATGREIADIPLPANTWGSTLSFRGTNVTAYGEGSFMTYDLKAQKVIAKGEDFGHGSKWNWVTPGGTYAVCSANNPKRFTIVDTRNCVAAGKITVPDLGDVIGEGVPNLVQDIAFTDDGQLMAALFIGKYGSRTRRAILTWDMRTGELVGEALAIADGKSFMSFDLVRRDLQWFPDKSKWLILNREVVDAATGQTLWTSETKYDAATFVGDGRLFVKKSAMTQHFTLSVQQLPIDEINEAQAKARAGEPFTPSTTPLGPVR